MTRTALRELVDRLPEQEVEHVAELIIAYESGDRTRVAELLVPEDDAEPDEIEAMRELEEHPELAETVPLDRLKAELNL